MAKPRRLQRDVCVVGAGMSSFGMFADRDTKSLCVEAFSEAIESVVTRPEIDALYLGNFSSDVFSGQSHWGAILAETLGLLPKPATRIEGACASSALAVREAVFAIASGFYDVVLVVGFEEMSKRTTEEVAEGLGLAASPYEQAVGYTFPGVFATLATAYFDRYNVDRSHLSAVTIKSHDNAAKNPKAQIRATIPELMQRKIKRAEERGQPTPQWDDELAFLSDPRANPCIAWPMHLFDCSPISDGAACLLLAAENMAGEVTDSPIRIAGIGQGSGPALHAAADLTSLVATKTAAAEAYRMAGITSEDIQVAEVHDCFSIAEVLHIEDLGFFEPGQGAAAIVEGKTRLDGVIPVNTSGGLKCKGHPVGATGVAQMVEIVHQLRGTAGARQVAGDLRYGLAHSLGGTGGTCAVTVLEKR